MLDTELLRKYAKPVAVLDSCKGAECEKEKAKEEDGEEGKALDAASAFALSEAALEAAAAVQAWLEEEPEEGETYADTLQDAFLEDADANEDGDLSDDETALIDARLNAAYEYMISKGASEEDAYKLLSEWNADAAERVHDLLVEKMPDGEAADADIERFAFGPESEEAVMDSGRYEKKMVFHSDGSHELVRRKIGGAINLKRSRGSKKGARKRRGAAIIAKRLKANRYRKMAGR